MPTLLSARSRGTHATAAAAAAAGSVGTDDNRGPGNGACYAIAACAVALLLFCSLAATVSIRMAFAFGGLALVTFAIAGCLAPSGNRADPSGDDVIAESTAADAEAAARARRRLGMPKAAIDVLPTFAYTVVNVKSGDESGGDLEAGEAAGGVVMVEQCSVCLEDFGVGEMVRRLPACKHLFHLECIDMWLESHRTCPVCRCNLLRSQRKVAAVKAAAPVVADEEEVMVEDALPPV